MPLIVQVGQPWAQSLLTQSPSGKQTGNRGGQSHSEEILPETERAVAIDGTVSQQNVPGRIKGVQVWSVGKR